MMRLFQKPQLISLRINPDVLSDGKQSTAEFKVQGWGFIWARLAGKRRTHECVLQIVGWFLPMFAARFLHALIWPLSFFNEIDTKWSPIKKFCADSNSSNQLSVPFGDSLEVNVFNIFGYTQQTISVPIPVENVPALKIDLRQYQMRNDFRLSGNIYPELNTRISVTQFSERLTLPNVHGQCAALNNVTSGARFPLSSSPPQAGERDSGSLREFHDKVRFSKVEIQPYTFQSSNDRTES